MTAQGPIAPRSSSPRAPDAAAPGATARSGGRASELTGTAALYRLAWRRERYLLPSWVLGLAGTAYFSAAATVGLYPDAAQRIAAAETVNGSAALVALYGRIIDPTSVGELSLFKLTALGTAIVAVLVSFTVLRHTRADEEAGRSELLGSTAVGRLAPLAAALLLSLTACVTLALTTGVGLAAAGLPTAGSFAYGAGWGAAGLFFAAAAAVIAQVTVGARSARGLALTVIAVAYVVRAVGDLAEQGPSWLSWLSPIGWTQQVRAFSGTRLPILVVPLVGAAILVAAAYALRVRRDLGAGLLADRAGRSRGRLGSPLGLAWRLQRATFVGWAVACALLGLVLGSMASNVTGLLESPQVQRILEVLGGEQGLTDAFLAAELGIIGIILGAVGISSARWLAAEEDEGRAEVVLAGSTSRLAWASAHVIVAVVGVAALILLSGLAVGVAHAAATSDASQVSRVVGASAVRIPAAALMIGATVALWGAWPRIAGLIWVLYAAAFALTELGQVWGLPQWVIDLSPFSHTPTAPVAVADPSRADPLTAILALSGVAAALLAVGFLAFRRRDIASR